MNLEQKSMGKFYVTECGSSCDIFHPFPPKASDLQNLEALANHLGVVKHSTCTVEVQPMGQKSFLNLIVMESHQDY